MKKYLCLAYYAPDRMAALPAADIQAIVSQCPARDAQLKATGQLVVSASLQGPDGVIHLKPRGGKTKVTDGPFSETKELVGGFFIIEAADRDEAVRLASLHPAASGCCFSWKPSARSVPRTPVTKRRSKRCS